MGSPDRFTFDSALPVLVIAAVLLSQGPGAAGHGQEALDRLVRQAIEGGWAGHRAVFEHLGNRLLRNHETPPANLTGATFELEKPAVKSMGTLTLDNHVEQFNFNNFRATGFHLKQENATVEYHYSYRKAKNGVAEGKLIAEALETIYDVTLSSKRRENDTVCRTGLELLTVIKQVPLLVEVKGQKTADAMKLAHSINRWFSNEVNNFLYVNVYRAINDSVFRSMPDLC
ncbi:Hypothetical protein NTJ_04375 [Nesidiocoris tenuis]|uniref:Uncharacterized protein n=1 Tax=Nesidiocoris tenuis TaxID=355587 RepID=A0ABN7AH23_9HEMI|nr:Hypothetical protein NTJ_04375 [Nesidiocoris tenuis]